MNADSTENKTAITTSITPPLIRSSRGDSSMKWPATNSMVDAMAIEYGSRSWLVWRLPAMPTIMTMAIMADAHIVSNLNLSRALRSANKQIIGMQTQISRTNNGTPASSDVITANHAAELSPRLLLRRDICDRTTCASMNPPILSGIQTSTVASAIDTHARMTTGFGFRENIVAMNKMRRAGVSKNTADWLNLSAIAIAEARAICRATRFGSSCRRKAVKNTSRKAGPRALSDFAI